MARRHSKPGRRLRQTKRNKRSHTAAPSPLTQELSTRLDQFSEHLYHLLSGYYLYSHAVFELTASPRQLHDDRLLMGLSLTGNWLSEQGEQLYLELAKLQTWITEEHA
jgi:hypothetical protein